MGSELLCLTNVLDGGTTIQQRHYTVTLKPGLPPARVIVLTLTAYVCTHDDRRRQFVLVLRILVQAELNLLTSLRLLKFLIAERQAANAWSWCCSCSICRYLLTLLPVPVLHRVCRARMSMTVLTAV